jgi:hypothetical protein
MPTYPETAQKLLEACDAYLNRQLGLAEIKNAVWSSAQEIVLVDERGLRDFLQTAEGRLDMVEHTTDAAAVFEATTPVVREVRQRVAAYLNS